MATLHQPRRFFPNFSVLSSMGAAALAACAMLSGCAASDPPVAGGPDSEEAGIRYESARREYNNCIRNEGPGTPTCDALKALYERDRDAYENSVR